ncbi:MAG: PolC-type DNA polymerase III [Erysipelotrichaceae bacterium]|nr:PolC-type DNA polymerase III [Erysipelotrichaceae bacterium]
MDLITLINKSKFTNEELKDIDTAFIDRPIHIKKDKLVVLKLHVDKTLSFDLYKKLLDHFIERLKCSIKLIIIVKKCQIDSFEAQNYLNYLSGLFSGGRIFNNAMAIVDKDKLSLVFANQHLVDKAIPLFDDMQTRLHDCGITFSIEIKNKTEQQKVKKIISKNDLYSKRTISSLNRPQRDVELDLIIYKIEEGNPYRRNNQPVIINYYLKDNTGYIIGKREVSESLKDRALGEFQIDDQVTVRADVRLFRLNNELELMITDIFKNNHTSVAIDDALEKRIELHAHTKYSEMDAVCDLERLIKKAFDWNHDAIAITDHMVVQAYPKAQIYLNKLLKNDKSKDFKIIYGIEMNMIDPDLNIVINSDHRSLNEDYVVFDLETTGLSARYDQIIEFGAVKIQNGTITDKLQLFINPRLKLSDFTINMTNITQNDVDNGLLLVEAFPKILAFFKDATLVAQNATFDVGFLNAKMNEYNLGKLKNPIIDTLDMARALNKEKKRYRLGNIAKIYKIDYDENVAHRADYDANITAQIFILMLTEAQNRLVMQGIDIKDQTLEQLQKFSDDESFKKVIKKHVTLLAKNQDGIKDIFKLVSISHTDYLVFSGKANNKNGSDEYMAEPRIPRCIINDNRENLLVGSACLNGELFEIAANQTQDQLEEAIKFYDYIEVQPPENYYHLIEDNRIPNKERLFQILNNLISTSEKMGKIVVATGDVHYVEPEDKLLRDIYIHSKGIGGTVHPLFIYNNARRVNSVSPDQHLRTTNEMLKCFDFLDDNIKRKIVIDNTKLINQMIDKCYPIKDSLYTPKIEGSDELLTELCYKNAYETYGKPLPKIIEDRLQIELDSIIKNGYGVIYYTAYLLVKKSNEDGYLVGSRGSVGSSFVATMANITEVNPLPAHYICSTCHHSDFNVIADSGYDLPDKKCPNCGSIMHGEGQDIPFETFLGFEGDKVPDIDLNFSSEYQEKAHAYTKDIFGEDKVFRAGTINTVAEKTAYGYLKGYMESMQLEKEFTSAERTYIAQRCENVKRTTGQHPGGIVVIPKDMDVHDFTPYQYPANNPNSEWRTTHFEFNDIHDNILKLDILGHVDPTAMRLLERLTNVDVRKIPMNDNATISLFYSVKALKINDKGFKEKTGAMGLPEFGTKFVRGILEEAKPKSFSDLLRISGLSHGTDVWTNNAKDLIKRGILLNDVIGCRDDIMVYLIKKGLPSREAFEIMESVRKGKGLRTDWIANMKANKVPDWYIDSCQKIKYMFPKAHAVAYCIMAVRVGWFKINYPLQYYISYFTLRCNAYDIKTMCDSYQVVVERYNELLRRSLDKEEKKMLTTKESELINTLEVTREMMARGYRFSKISLEFSTADEFIIDPSDNSALIPPFITIDGLGLNVARSIVLARDEKMFISKQDLLTRTQISSTLLKKLDDLRVLDHLQNENQLQLF